MSYFFSKTTTLFDDLTLASDSTNNNRQPNVRSQIDIVKADIVSKLQKHASIYKERKMVIVLSSIFETVETGSDIKVKTPTGLSFQNAMAGTYPPTPTKSELTWFANSLIVFFSTEGIKSHYDSITDTLTVEWIGSLVSASTILPKSETPLGPM